MWRSGDVGNAGSKACALPPIIKQPEGAPQGGWQWDWPWVSVLKWVSGWEIITILSYSQGYTSQHKQHQWQKTGHKVQISKILKSSGTHKMYLPFVEIYMILGSCMGQQVQGWAQEEKIWWVIMKSLYKPFFQPFSVYFSQSFDNYNS